jgi:hypothetical protein
MEGGSSLGVSSPILVCPLIFKRYNYLTLHPAFTLPCLVLGRVTEITSNISRGPLGDLVDGHEQC